MAIGVLVGSSGCRSTDEWNSSVDLSEHSVVVVEDFEYAGGDLGEAFADQLAAELRERGAFEQVLRERPEGKALVIGGAIRHYAKGNVAARMKAGRGVGEARLALTAWISVWPSGEQAGRMEIDESTLKTGPDARRTGRETGGWLRRQVVKEIADQLLERRRYGRG